MPSPNATPIKRPSTVPVGEVDHDGRNGAEMA
jgi:hypothetical protein